MRIVAKKEEEKYRIRYEYHITFVYKCCTVPSVILSSSSMHMHIQQTIFFFRNRLWMYLFVNALHLVDFSMSILYIVYIECILNIEHSIDYIRLGMMKTEFPLLFFSFSLRLLHFIFCYFFSMFTQ